MKHLECIDLICSFGGVMALDKASLSLAQGETVAVVGENAAGKTTLLNAISGLVTLDSGQIILRGRDISRYSFERRHHEGIQVIRTFDARSVWEKVSVVDNVAAAALFQGTSVARVSAKAWIRQLGLEFVSRHAKVKSQRSFRSVLRRFLEALLRHHVCIDRLLMRKGEDISAGELSIGQQRRVALARALYRFESLGSQGVLLLDEPFRGLDEMAREELMQLMQKHVLGKVSTLIVEHDRKRAQEVADRVLWARGGQIHDTPPETPSQRDGLKDSLPHQFSTAGDGGLVCRNLRAGYDGRDVLKGLSLECRPGEGLQILGKNGSGKSTLMRVLTGSIPVSQGTVLINSRPISLHCNIPRFGIGYVPQGGRVVNSLTVERHLDLARAAAGRRQGGNSEIFFTNLFPEALGLKGQAGNLSSGQRSMLALWLAFCSEPNLLILDEPTASLSPDLRERLYHALIHEWLRPDRMLLVVEHAFNPEGFSRVLIEQGGTRRQCGPEMSAANGAGDSCAKPGSHLASGISSDALRCVPKGPRPTHRRWAESST